MPCNLFKLYSFFILSTFFKLLHTFSHIGLPGRFVFFSFSCFHVSAILFYVCLRFRFNSYSINSVINSYLMVRFVFSFIISLISLSIFSHNFHVLCKHLLISISVLNRYKSLSLSLSSVCTQHSKQAPLANHSWSLNFKLCFESK